MRGRVSEYEDRVWLRVWVTSPQSRPRELRAMVVVVTLDAIINVHVAEVWVSMWVSVSMGYGGAGEVGESEDEDRAPTSSHILTPSTTCEPLPSHTSGDALTLSHSSSPSHAPSSTSHPHPQLYPFLHPHRHAHS